VSHRRTHNRGATSNSSAGGVPRVPMSSRCRQRLPTYTSVEVSGRHLRVALRFWEAHSLYCGLTHTQAYPPHTDTIAPEGHPIILPTSPHAQVSSFLFRVMGLSGRPTPESHPTITAVVSPVGIRHISPKAHAEDIYHHHLDFGYPYQDVDVRLADPPCGGWA